MRRPLMLLAVATLALAACSGDDGSTDATLAPTAPTTQAPGTQPPVTEPPSTEPPVTAPPVTDPPVTVPPVTDPPVTDPPVTEPPSTETCTPFGSTDDVQVDFPGTPSSLHGETIRTGVHDCFDRFVIEFAGDGPMPGYWVHYVDDPITLGQSEDNVTVLRGTANLLVHVNSWMGDMSDNTLWDIEPILPSDTEHLQEMYLVDNSEGVMRWALGIDEERPVRVSVLPDPARLVVDVYTG